jgi:hypothetical protein
MSAQSENVHLERVLEAIGDMIDGIVAQECMRHYHAETQEHQLTAKIAGAIEHQMGGASIDGYTVGMAIQDVPDKGKGSKERKTGADLYISLNQLAKACWCKPSGTIALVHELTWMLN